MRLMNVLGIPLQLNLERLDDLIAGFSFDA